MAGKKIKNKKKRKAQDDQKNPRGTGGVVWRYKACRCNANLYPDLLLGVRWSWNSFIYYSNSSVWNSTEGVGVESNTFYPMLHTFRIATACGVMACIVSLAV